MHDVGKTHYTVWDIVTGKLQHPKEKTREEEDTDKMKMTVKKRMTK
jgi:hypothetical protein